MIIWLLAVSRQPVFWMGKELILGLDVGSSSVRGALFDSGGRMLDKTFVRDERRLTATHNGGAEIDAEKAFRQVVATTDAILESSSKIKGEIIAVASCLFWHSLLGVDERGNPTTPVYGWADNQSRNYVDALRRRFDESEVQNRNGARFHSSFWPAKLLWVRKTQPEIWAKTAKWMSFGDFVALKLFGRTVSSVSMASGTGIFDVRKCEWDTELLRYLKIGFTKLPEIVPNDNCTFKLSEKWRKCWPRLAAAAWTPPIADGVANSIGSGCIDETKAALMIGTSAAVRIVYKGDPPKKLPSGLWCYRVDREHVILGGALSDGGGLYDHLKRLLRVELSDAAVSREIQCRAPDSHGLTVLPFFAGERSTGYDEFAAGSIHGMTMATGAIDILQAAMEGVAYRIAEVFGQISRICPVREIIVSGGALNASPAWTQIIADVLARDLVVSARPEASLSGAVLLALESTGKIDLAVKNTTKQNLKIRSRPKIHSVYKLAMERQARLIETVSYPNK
jgi:gluconokinase